MNGKVKIIAENGKRRILINDIDVSDFVTSVNVTLNGYEMPHANVEFIPQLLDVDFDICNLTDIKRGIF